jgi:hypothetical protein
MRSLVPVVLAVGLLSTAVLVAGEPTAIAATPAPIPLTSRASADARASAQARTDFGMLSRSFPALASAPSDASALAGAAPGTRVTSYLADNAARIDGPGGKAVVLATRPLRVLDAHGRSLPVDLTLERAADGMLVPRNAPFSLTLSGDPSDGFALGPDSAHALHVTPLSGAPDPVVTLQGNEVFADGTHQDGDTLLRPTTTGLESYEQLRGPDAPSVFAWRLDLRAGQRASLAARVLTVEQDGQAIVVVPEPIAYDADHALVPTVVRFDRNVLTVTVSPPANVAYPLVVDPVWESRYDWGTNPAAFGTEGWFAESPIDPLYTQAILTGPDGSGLNPGITIAPRTDTGAIFRTGDQAAFNWRSPGTTTIRAAHFRDVHEINDSARQTSRLGLFQGTPGGVQEVDDFFATDHVRDVPDVELDDAGTAHIAVVSMFTPPCTDGGTPPNRCIAIPPASDGGPNRTILQIGSVDLILDDNDLPTARASGSVRELAGTWSAASETQTVHGDFADAGSGVAGTALNVTRPGTAAPVVHDAVTACNPNHTRPGQGSNICPAAIGQDFGVDLGQLPEGQLQFDLAATDFAGNASDDSAGDSWDVFIDRTAPTIAASGPLRDAAGAWVDPADIAAGTRLMATDARAGVASITFDASDETGNQIVHDTTETCQSRGPIGAPCPTQAPVNVPIDPDTLPEGRLDLTATAADFAGNQSARASWSLHLDRTRPAARAEGDLVALQDQWTNRTAPIDLTLDGRDAGSGAKQLRLVAVNSDGRAVLKQVDVCGAADLDPTDGSCPHRVSRTVTVDPTELPDGKSTFEVEAVDLAGQISSTSQSWDAYVDHTPPPAPTGLAVVAKSLDTAAISWNRVVDSPDGSPAVSYQYLVKAGDQTIVNWTSTPYPTAVVPGLPPGADIEVLLRAQDASGNLSPVVKRQGALPRFLPDGPDSETSAHAAAVEQFVTYYAPYLFLDLGDGFYPISFYWVPRMLSPSGDVACVHNDSACVQRPIHLPLRGTQGAGEYLEYPARNDRAAQENLINHTLTDSGYGSFLPQSRAAMGYYLVSKADKQGSFVVQYWYFWTYNYFNESAAGFHIFDLDKHEGDLEHADIRFSRTGKPLTITMSRHETDQYKTFAWGRAPVSYVGPHPKVYAARGDHALYERCSSGLGFQLYHHDGPLPAWDHTCQGGAVIAVDPLQVTAKINNAAGTWACWQGKLGNHGPGAPIRQSLAPGVRALCSSQARSARRATTAQVTIPAATDPGLKCRSFESPPTERAGVTAVACDQQQVLDSLSGTAAPSLSWTLDADAKFQHYDGPPATASSDDPSAANRLRLVAHRAADPEIYVATVHDGRYTYVRFPPLHLDAGETLRLSAPSTRDWTLADTRGDTVAKADPHRQALPVPPAPHGPRPPQPVRLHIRPGARTSIVSWRVSGPTTRHVTFYVVTSPRRGHVATVVPVARVIGRGQRRFAVRIENRHLRGRLIHVVASRGANTRRSKAIPGR